MRPRSRPPARGVVLVPDELRRCWASDWLTPDEVEVWNARQYAGEDVAMDVVHVGYRRHRAARRAWAREHHVQPAAVRQLLPLPYPRVGEPPLLRTPPPPVHEDSGAPSAVPRDERGQDDEGGSVADPG